MASSPDRRPKAGDDGFDSVGPADDPPDLDVEAQERHEFASGILHTAVTAGYCRATSRKMFRIRCTIQLWSTASSHTAVTVFDSPLSPSQAAMQTSSTPGS